jgi:hypothetical protein
MKTTQVYNHSRCVLEQATRKKCPACRGFGNYTTNNEDSCLCNGYGWLWMSHSGWIKAPYKRAMTSRLY